MPPFEQRSREVVPACGIIGVSQQPRAILRKPGSETVLFIAVPENEGIRPRERLFQEFTQHRSFQRQARHQNRGPARLPESEDGRRIHETEEDEDGFPGKSPGQVIEERRGVRAPLPYPLLLQAGFRTTLLDLLPKPLFERRHFGEVRPEDAPGQTALTIDPRQTEPVLAPTAYREELDPRKLGPGERQTRTLLLPSGDVDNIHAL